MMEVPCYISLTIDVAQALLAIGSNHQTLQLRMKQLDRDLPTLQRKVPNCPGSSTSDLPHSKSNSLSSPSFPQSPYSPRPPFEAAKSPLAGPRRCLRRWQPAAPVQPHAPLAPSLTCRRQEWIYEPGLRLTQCGGTPAWCGLQPHRTTQDSFRSTPVPWLR